MRRWITGLLVASTLAACGAEAEPERVETQNVDADLATGERLESFPDAAEHQLGREWLTDVHRWQQAAQWIEAERRAAEEEQAREASAAEAARDVDPLPAPSSDASSAVAHFAPGASCVIEYHDGFPFCGTPILWSTPCAIPAYICERESLRWINVLNAQTEDAAGKYQFLLSTWTWAAAQAGYPEWSGQTAALAPESVQDAVAAWLWNQSPCHWHAC
jgi:hypothetical protein